MPSERPSTGPNKPLNKHVARIGVGLAVGGAVWLGVSVIAPTLVPKRFHEVDEGKIYRSGKLNPATFEKVVTENNIKTIVDLGAWQEGSKGDLLAQRTADALGAKRIRLQLEGDATGDPNNYVEALRILTDPAMQPVLVHCGAGTERTGATVYWYRTLVQGWDPARAEAEVDAVGHSDSRNPLWDVVVRERTEAVRQSLETGEPIDLDALTPIKEAAGD